MGKHLKMISLIFLLLLILSGCSNDGEESNTSNDENIDDKSPIVVEVKDPTEGGVLKVGVFELPSWDPFKWESATPTYSTAERLVFRGLFTYDEQNQLVPDLIQSFSIEQLEDNVSVLRMKLDDEVKWHDGTQITFDDVSFTLHTYLDPFYYGAWKQNLSYINGTSAFRSGKADSIKGIRQDENGEIVIELSGETSSFYHALTAPILPSHQLKDLTIEEMRKRLSDGQVVGSGPFAFQKKTDTELHLTRAAEFANGGPYLDGIAFLKYDGNVNGITDTSMYDIVAVPPQSSDTVVEGYKAYDVAQNIFYYLGFNVEDEVLKNREVRSAILDALDRNAIVDNILYGHGKVIDQIVPAQSWLTMDEVRSQNVESAKKQMADLGYSDAKRLQLTIHYQGSNPLLERIVDVLSKQLSAVYIDVKKQPLTEDEYYAYLFSGKPVQAFLHAWPFSNDIGYWWKLFGSYHHVKDLGLNIYRFTNEQADQWLQELYYNPPGEHQRQTAQQFMELFNNEKVIIPLFVAVQTYWVSSKLHDQVINGDGWFINSTKWWIEN